MVRVGGGGARCGGLQSARARAAGAAGGGRWPWPRPPTVPLSRYLTSSPRFPPDLEWKVVYVGSASGPQYDQELDAVLVGPVPIGTSKFVLQVRRVASRASAMRRSSANQSSCLSPAASCHMQ